MERRLVKQTSPKKLTEFKKAVWTHYRTHGRHTLPWRKNYDPYQVLVSEIMLQQTQVDRVIPYFNRFVKKFPTVRSLASARLSDVLMLWQGLGYNRRGKHLHEAAKAVVARHKGHMPREEAELRALPGIGPYLAGAVMAFAYNKPVIFIETNIRTVVVYHFFLNRDRVTDLEIASILEEAIDRKRPREWYSALMDYGSFLKKQGMKLNHTNHLYRKQSKFKGSPREVRGAVIRELTKTPRLSATALRRVLPFEKTRIDIALEALMQEKLITLRKGAYSLAE